MKDLVSGKNIVIFIFPILNPFLLLFTLTRKDKWVYTRECNQ